MSEDAAGIPLGAPRALEKLLGVRVFAYVNSEVRGEPCGFRLNPNLLLIVKGRRRRPHSRRTLEWTCKARSCPLERRFGPASTCSLCPSSTGSPLKTQHQASYSSPATVSHPRPRMSLTQAGC